MAVFHCPACNYLKTVEDKHLGRSAGCPKCKTSGKICDPKDLISQKNAENEGKPLTMDPVGSPPPLPIPAKIIPPQEPAPTSLDKAMGRCPVCGEASFDLGNHYARKHPQSTGIVSGATGASASDVTLAPSRAAASECATPMPKEVEGANALYVKARNVNEGMHRFHKYVKLASYGAVGFALWANDLADSWVGYLCNKVDNATQSTLWSWTFGLFSSQPPAITPLYRWYNFIMTVLGFVGIVWFSRWFFWTMLMMKLEDHQQPYKQGDIHTVMYRVYGCWIAEYVAAGVLINVLIGWLVPFTVPWAPTFTSLAMAATGAVTVGMLEDSHASTAVKPTD